MYEDITWVKTPKDNSALLFSDRKDIFTQLPKTHVVIKNQKGEGYEIGVNDGVWEALSLSELLSQIDLEIGDEDD